MKSGGPIVGNLSLPYPDSRAISLVHDLLFPLPGTNSSTQIHVKRTPKAYLRRQQNMSKRATYGAAKKVEEAAFISE